MTKSKAYLEEPLAPLQIDCVLTQQQQFLSPSWSLEDLINVFNKWLALSRGLLWNTLSRLVTIMLCELEQSKPEAEEDSSNPFSYTLKTLILSLSTITSCLWGIKLAVSEFSQSIKEIVPWPIQSLTACFPSYTLCVICVLPKENPQAQLSKYVRITIPGTAPFLKITVAIY